VAADSNDAQAREDLAIAYGMLGDAMVAKGDAAGALRSYQLSLGISEAMAAHDPADVFVQRNLAEALGGLAKLTRSMGRLNESRAYQMRLLRIQKTQADRPEADPRDVSSYARSLLTAELKALRDPRQALAYATRAVELTKGTDARALDVQALAQHMTGDHARAITTEERALSLAQGDSALRRELEARLATLKGAPRAP
jgi:tetratricopeptide (TPR) repeat protein